MSQQEIPLPGGNVTGAVRIDQTVHRAMGPWNRTVHHLLQYLEAQGFAGAPQFLGIDEQGREILTFIEGEVGNYPLPHYMWADESLIEVARFLRRYHDLTASYTPPENALWQLPYPDHSRHEVICHNDVAPYNMVYTNGKPHALIDFDTAGPGPRVWDLAYAAYRFVPLMHASDPEIVALGLTWPQEQGRRLHLFCQTYGTVQPHDVLAMVEPRLQALCSLMISRADLGDTAYRKMIDDGHLAGYIREIEALRHTSSAILQSL